MDQSVVVVNGAANMRIEYSAFVQSSTRGLSVFADDVTVADSAFVDNGLAGLHAARTARLAVERNVFTGNNAELFATNQSPVNSGGGMKITGSTDVAVKHNLAEHNHGNGIWLDLSCNNGVIVGNVARRNDDAGIFGEVSHNLLFASNVLVGRVKSSGADRSQVVVRSTRAPRSDEVTAPVMSSKTCSAS